MLLGERRFRAYWARRTRLCYRQRLLQLEQLDELDSCVAQPLFTAASVVGSTAKVTAPGRLVGGGGPENCAQEGVDSCLQLGHAGSTPSGRYKFTQPFNVSEPQ
jgi:hypothetical protein